MQRTGSDLWIDWYELRLDGRILSQEVELAYVNYIRNVSPNATSWEANSALRRLIVSTPQSATASFALTEAPDSVSASVTVSATPSSHSEQKHRTSPATDVEKPLVATQIQAVQQFRPNAELSLLGCEKKAHSRRCEYEGDDQAKGRQPSPCQRPANRGCEESPATPPRRIQLGHMANQFHNLRAGSIATLVLLLGTAERRRTKPRQARLAPDRTELFRAIMCCLTPAHAAAPPRRRRARRRSRTTTVRRASGTA